MLDWKMNKSASSAGRLSNAAKVFFLLIFISISRSYDPYNPQDNRSPYTDSDTLLTEGSLFPFGNEFPSARVLHSLDASRDYLFVYGGLSSNGTSLGDINLYHIPSERWSGPIVREECCNDLSQQIETIGTKLSTKDITFFKVGFQGDFPLPRSDHASCVVDDVLYIHGGETDRDDFGLLNDLYAFDPLQVRWRSIDNAISSTGRFPERRAGHSMVVDSSNSRCFLFGGRRSSRGTNTITGSSDLWELDTKTFSWRQLDLPTINSVSRVSPPGRHHSSITILRSRWIFVYGGSDPASGLLFRDIWVFDLQGLFWQQLYPVSKTELFPTYEFSPPPMEHAHLIPFASDEDPSDDGFLVYGGVGTGGGCIAASCNSHQVVFGQVYFYSLKQKTWQRPFFDIHSDAPNAQTESNWLFARLHDQFQRKRLKEYAYEKVALLPARGLMYEFGGLESNANSIRRNNQQAPATGIDNTGNPFNPPKNAPTQEVGGRIPSTYSDTMTGEAMEAAVRLPSNGFWNIPSALFNGSIFNNDYNGTILFHRTLRTYTVAPRDVVMIHAYDIDS